MNSVSFADDSLELWHKTSNHIVVHIWNLFSIYSILELKFVVWQQCWQYKLAHNFHKSLSNADSRSAKEWTKAKWIPPLAIWSQKVGTLWVKSLWNELIGFLPLVWISSKVAHPDWDHISLSNFELFTLDGWADPDSWGVVDRRHHSKRLVEAIGVESQVGVVFVVDQRQNIKLVFSQGLAFLEITTLKQICEVWRNNLAVDFLQDFVLILWMLA